MAASHLELTISAMTEAGQKGVRNGCLNQRARCRRKKGSYHRRKAARNGAKTQLKMARQRRDCHVKTATPAAECSHRIVEDVAITSMVQNHFLAFAVAQSHQQSPEAD